MKFLNNAPTDSKRFERPFWSLVSNQLREYPLPYFLGFICLVATHYIQSELPFLARELVKHAALTNKEVAVFVLMAIGIIFFRTTSRILFFTPARLMQKELRKELIQVITTSSPFRYRELSQGDLFQYLTGDIDQIRALIGFVGLQLGNIVIAFFILVPRLVDFHPELIWTLLPMFICFFIFTYVVARNKEEFRLMQKSSGELQNNIIEAFQGKKTIKNFHSEDEFIKHFKAASAKELGYFYRTSLGISFSLPMMALGIGMSLVMGAYIIYTRNMKPEDFVLFSGFIFLFMEPINYLSWIGMVVSRSSASWKRLRDFYGKLMTPSLMENELEKSVTFSSDGVFKLPFWEHHIDVSFKSGQWLVFVGQTGVGKTELLTRLAEAMAKKKMTLSFTFQDPYLFNDTISANLFLGKVPSSEEIARAKNYLKLFGLDYIDNNMDRLLMLEVGENGKRLSGGQAKRLQLARALLSDAEYIFWDDPFSSVDLILEKEILQALKKDPYLKDKTFLLTSHRLSTVRYVDLICYLDKEVGVVEHGHTNTLLSPGTKTYEYFKLQMV